MLKYSQYSLIASLMLVVLALVCYVLVLVLKKPVRQAPVMASAGVGSRGSSVDDDDDVDVVNGGDHGTVAPAVTARPRALALYGTHFTRLALVGEGPVTDRDGPEDKAGGEEHQGEPGEVGAVERQSAGPCGDRWGYGPVIATVDDIDIVIIVNAAPSRADAGAGHDRRLTNGLLEHENQDVADQGQDDQHEAGDQAVLGILKHRSALLLGWCSTGYRRAVCR